MTTMTICIEIAFPNFGHLPKLWNSRFMPCTNTEIVDDAGMTWKYKITIWKLKQFQNWQSIHHSCKKNSRGKKNNDLYVYVRSLGRFFDLRTCYLLLGYVAVNIDCTEFSDDNLDNDSVFIVSCCIFSTLFLISFIVIVTKERQQKKALSSVWFWMRWN